MSWDDRIVATFWGELAVQLWDESVRQEAWRFRVNIITFAQFEDAQRYATSADQIIVEGDASK
jgi:hypothetical protein